MSCTGSTSSSTGSSCTATTEISDSAMATREVGVGISGEYIIILVSSSSSSSSLVSSSMFRIPSLPYAAVTEPEARTEEMEEMAGDAGHARGLAFNDCRPSLEGDPSTVALLSLLARALGEPMRSRKLKTAS